MKQSAIKAMLAITCIRTICFADIIEIMGQKHYKFGDSTYVIEDGKYLTERQAKEVLRQAERLYESEDFLDTLKLKTLWDDFTMVYDGPLKGEVLSVVLRAHFARLLKALQESKDRVFVRLGLNNGYRYEYYGADRLCLEGYVSFGIYESGQDDVWKKFKEKDRDVLMTRRLLEEYRRKVPDEDPFIASGKLTRLGKSILSAYTNTRIGFGQEVHTLLCREIERAFDELADASGRAKTKKPF